MGNARSHDPGDHASAALASNPGAELALLDGTGHTAPHPSGAVAERLSSFINDSPAHAPEMADSRVTGSSSAPAGRAALCVAEASI